MLTQSSLWSSYLLFAARWVSHTLSSRARPGSVLSFTKRPLLLSPSRKSNPRTSANSPLLFLLPRQTCMSFVGLFEVIVLLIMYTLSALINMKSNVVNGAGVSVVTSPPRSCANAQRLLVKMPMLRVLASSEWIGLAILGFMRYSSRPPMLHATHMLCHVIIFNMLLSCTTFIVHLLLFG